MSGLRERKKERTRADIQWHALRLFRERGYAATTVGQIAEAAGVSQSTFFRYFASKEDAVLRDVYDAQIVGEFAAQPPDLSPLRAACAAIHAVYARMSGDDATRERERHLLIRSTPELRSRLVDSLGEGIRTLADTAAERAGRRRGDFAARTLAGALVGVTLSAMLAAADDPEADAAALLNEGLRLLQEGLPL